MTKKTNTKRALLMSGLALLMCVSMLIGSTFAWFTDSVTSAGNIIQSGTLDVDLVDADGNSMAGKVIEFVTADNRAQDAILWEPGCTYETKPVFVVNKGNLALKYQMVINGIVGDAKLLEAIDWTVTVNGVTTDLTDLNGELLAGETTEALVLSGHMKEEAGNEYQGLTAEGISIAVYATQLTSENDSFNNQYDANARLEYTYDSSKNAKENAAALQALINTAVEGATIVVSEGTYDVSGISGSQIKLTKDNVTLLGNGNVTINDDGEGSNNVQAVILIKGDNVTVSNISATDKGGNTVILISDANNVTVSNCTLKGYADPTWGQYLEAGVMIYTNDPAVTPITKYTVTNNTFIDCNINVMNGAGNSGKAEDLIISGNTFKNAAVLIEHNQTSVPDGNEEAWHKYDINVLPTIKNNLFESPSIWLGSTPFAIYLRVYRDNNVTAMTPASYWADFVADNTIMEYAGEKISTDGTATLVGENGIQMRPNGKIQYYGLNFAKTVSDASSLVSALANGGEFALTSDVVLNENITIAADKEVSLDLNGNTLAGAFNNNGGSALIDNKGSLTITNGTVVALAQYPDVDWGTEGFPTYATNTIRNSGKLVIGEGAVIENQTLKGGASYAIDCYPGSDLIIDGGVVKQTGGDQAIRMFANSNTIATKVTVNSGTIEGRRAIWVQLPGSNSSNQKMVDLTINGGTLTGTSEAVYSYSYGDSFAKTNITITGGTFNGDVSFGGGYKGDTENVTITGGTFNGQVGRWITEDDFQPITVPTV